MGAAQSAGSSYDKHSQWKSRGTDAAESTESSCDKHSQWKRGSQDDAEAGLNSTKRIYRQRSRLFAYLKQTFGHHSATFDYLATGEMPALSPTGWEEECAVGSAFAEPYSIGLQANSELRSIAAAVP
jgi:hypothetical protein